MKFKPYQYFLIMTMVILITGCTVPTMKTDNTGNTDNIKSFNVYKEKTLEELGPFDFEKRMYIYESIDELANQLWNSPKSSTLRKEKTKASGEFFEMFPTFELLDRDMDGKADQFAYLPKRGRDSQEFGFIFDLNRDGNTDYIVFNGGPSITNTKDFKILWFNYHWIDSNYDGKMDIYVVNNLIDLDGDGFTDRGITAWVYDRNFDGIIDKGEYLGEGFVKPIEKKGRVFIIKTIIGEKETGDFDFKEDNFINQIFSDINSIMR